VNIEFRPYETKKIINVHKHVDGPWFWGRYSAHPYVGCRSGCEFCYLRGGRYLGKRDPATFDSLIQVKINAVEQMRKEIGRLAPDVITCGDWQQPAEDRFGLSRGMLEVVRQSRFPLCIIERSPLLARDLDLLAQINRDTWAGVVYSISSLDPGIKRAFEPHSPGVKRRLGAMARLASAGITVGASLMPILPYAGDDEESLEALIVAVKDHGGTFVMSGGLTMDGVQAERTLAAAERHDPALAGRWRRLYQWPAGGKPSYGPPPEYSARLGLKVRELCARHGLADRMPRYIAPGPLAVNKRVAEQLFLKTYDLELAQAPSNQVWTYRKAAWTVDEWPVSVAEMHDSGGRAELQRIPGVGERLAGYIAEWLAKEMPADGRD
jgi:DNA repair photolyase